MSGRFVHFLHLSDEDKKLILEALLIAGEQLARDARDVERSLRENRNGAAADELRAKSRAMQSLYDRGRGAREPRRQDVRAGREG